MIQVIQRSFGALELLAQRSPQALPLGVIAQALSLHPATCANILKTLVHVGAVRAIPGRGGYTLGPSLAYLARRGGMGQDIALAAEGQARGLAGSLRETVVVATIQGGRRYTLCQIEGDRDLSVRSEFFSDDIFLTATGRVLVAHLGEGELAAMLRDRDGSGDDWPQLRQPAQRGRVLATIRRRGWELVRRDEVVAIARPLRQGEPVVAAIGIALPLSRFRGEHRRQVLAGLAAAADEINEALKR